MISNFCELDSITQTFLVDVAAAKILTRVIDFGHYLFPCFTYKINHPGRETLLQAHCLFPFYFP
jgi:hypothetical protein